MRDSRLAKSALGFALGATLLIMVSHAKAGTEALEASVDVGPVSQKNTGVVNSTGAFNQYNTAGSSFSSGGIPTYNRIGDTSCAAATMNIQAQGMQQGFEQGSIQMGITIPLGGGKCEDAQKDQISLMRFELHQKQVEQNKQNILFDVKMYNVCKDIKATGYTIQINNPLYATCSKFN